MITASTQLISIIGNPVSQAKSPANFNRLFARNGKDLAMIAMDVSPSALESCAALIRGWNNLLGCVITIPHKQAFARHVDVLSERARALGAVNVVRRDADGRLSGDLVDGLGFLAAARQHGFEPAGRRALIIGAGGAGGAIAFGLCEAGAAEMTLVDLAEDRLNTLSHLLSSKFKSTKLQGSAKDLSSFDLVVNATPVGTGSDQSLPLPAELLATLDAATLVADVVTSPAMTPLLQLAAARGCAVQTGSEMAAAQLGLLAAAMGLLDEISSWTPARQS